MNGRVWYTLAVRIARTRGYSERQAAIFADGYLEGIALLGPETTVTGRRGSDSFAARARQAIEASADRDKRLYKGEDAKVGLYWLVYGRFLAKSKGYNDKECEFFAEGMLEALERSEPEDATAGKVTFDYWADDGNFTWEEAAKLDAGLKL